MMTTAPSFFIPPIEELLPHRGTMLLLDRLCICDAEYAEAERVVQKNQWYSDDENAMPAWIGIELMAQTVALHVGMLAREIGNPPKQGVLVGTRAYRATVPRFASDLALRVVARVTYKDDTGLAAYDCEILNKDMILATATLKVFEPKDFGEFIQRSVS